jgi:4-amino-4-deoxy-L-arabinose transferase-like glycosyltransferase
MDEIRQTSFYANPLTEIIDNSASQNQPPLDYWLGHLVHFLTSSDFAVRLPAALFGTGSVLLLVILISQIT